LQLAFCEDYKRERSTERERKRELRIKKKYKTVARSKRINSRSDIHLRRF
jgi:hypothetical protein